MRSASTASKPERAEHAEWVEIRLVTPEWAAQLLAQDDPNRKVRLTGVDRYARAFAEGRGRLSNDAICLSRSGAVVNGQHRLRGIVKSGVALRCLVLHNVDDDTDKVIDSGLIRKAADLVRSRGFPSANTRAAAARFVLAMLSDAPGTAVFQAGLTDSEQVLAAVEQFGGLGDSISATHPAAVRKLLTHSRLAGLHYLFWHSPSGDKAQADEFFRELADGNGLSTDSAIYHLRERLLRDRLSKYRMSPKETVALTIKAWNRRFEKIGSLRWRSGGESGAEGFPTIT